MAQFITDIFAQLDKKRALLCAGTKEKHDTMTVNWGGICIIRSSFCFVQLSCACLCRFCFLQHVQLVVKLQYRLSG